MKKLFLSLALAIMCLATIAQPVTLTFTGRDANNRSVSLDRVEITNQTQNWQETLTYPDTILILSSTGIDDAQNISSMQLWQNVPNPFDGTTDFALQLPEAGKVSLTVYDLNGKKITVYQGKLAAGVHTFRVLLNTSQSYLLTARCGNETATIKMINNGNAGEHAIRYLGEGSLNLLLKSGSKGAIARPYAYGDDMGYIGYATINGKSCTSRTLPKKLSVSETIKLQFEEAIHFPPTVQTDTVSDITGTTATCGGKITSDGGAEITARGVCWNTLHMPTVGNSKTSDGTGAGSYTSSLTGLTVNTTYYVRAYAINSVGTVYGEEQSFKTLPPTLPAVTTGDVSNITGATASCGGNVTDDGGATVTARGVCWSTSSNPTISDSKTTDGSGIGSFNSNIKGLTTSTTYYVRAYATNRVGTAYGEEQIFKTLPPTLPAVITVDVSDITGMTATCGGNVTADGGATVTDRGVCWSTNSNPTVTDNKITKGSGLGVFSCNLFGLSPGETYHVRAYAINSVGTVYGEDVSFTTKSDGYSCLSTPLVTDRDGNEYHTVKLGEQCWMKENLKTTKYADGTDIKTISSGTSTTEARWYYPDGFSSYKTKYGLLYNRAAVMNGSPYSSTNPSGVQGVCPTGWHVPSLAEWKQLFDYVSSQQDYCCESDKLNIAKALASTTGWNTTFSSSPCSVAYDQKSNNATGFGMMPAGYYTNNPTIYSQYYYQFGDCAYFWTTTGTHPRIDKDGVIVKYEEKDSNRRGYSVRCLKD